MTRTGPYPDAGAVEAAIKHAAAAEHLQHRGRSMPALIRQAYYDRFLCRVFAGAPAGGWLLKGGTGVLARVADARATRDIDLQRSGVGLEEALAELLLLAGTDLGDHFRFVHVRTRPIGTGGRQPSLDGAAVSFDVLIGAKRVTTLTVDLVVGSPPNGAVAAVPPANRLPLPRLATCDYRVYPVEDQIADKVCAVMGTYPGGASSREKDLVDLVVLALTATGLDQATLRQALRAELARRRMAPPAAFAIPPRWGPAYRTMAAAVPQCRDHRDAAAASRLIAAMLDPVLTGIGGGTWDPGEQSWR